MFMIIGADDRTGFGLAWTGASVLGS